MSEHRQDTDNGQLPLPSPRSPRDLDERILAHARAKAPARPSHTAGWLGGMATTAVLVVAIYLTNTTETNQGPSAPPAVLKEERSAAGATAPAASQARAKLKASADLDTMNDMEAAPREREELQAAPAAEAAFDSVASQAMKRAGEPTVNLRGSLEHLAQLLADGKAEQAHREYTELRNACGECGLPETLDEALEQLD